MLKSKKFWGIAASFFFLWLALQKVDLKQIPAIAAGLRYQFVILMCISVTIEHLVRSWRWQFILAHRPLNLKFAYFGLLLGYLFNNLLPARAGEFLRAYYLKRKGIAPAGEAFGSVVVERFLDGIVIVSLIIASMFQFTATPLIRKASFSAVVFYCLVLLALVFMQFKKQLFVKITDTILSLLPEKPGDLIRKARDSFMNGLSLIGKPLIFIKALALSFVSWGFSMLTLWLGLEMFNLGAGLAETTLLISVLSIGAMIPASPGMIGVYEFCCVLVLNGMLKHSPEHAATFGLVSHSFGYFYVLAVGFTVLTIENLKFAELEKGEKEVFDAQESPIS
ncbi:MAG: lysylphosphatidylglycerol synthase transmembrane domain-containing protein [Candidatus Riflebacteria bacterium]|jgi:uncharacterized protein (TIRG00374 family)|nr:lysylphosphatidylglycerol synthase transmembrane domain-containing protein [Candidatus Riflebacteria bacterium]